MQSPDGGGCGRSAYADDLAAVVEALDLRDMTLVGFSTGGGEVARYIGRHGTGRVARVALVSAVPPFMLKTDDNPGGVPMRGGRRHPGRLAGRPLAAVPELADGPCFGNNQPGAHKEQLSRDLLAFADGGVRHQNGHMRTTA